MADDRRQQLADALRAAREGRCTVCWRPPATDDQWETVPEGEGEHLCWEPDNCGYDHFLNPEDVLGYALLPLLDQMAADAAAEALSAAADDWIKPNSPSLPVRTWLPARAAELRAPARTDEEN